MIYYLSCNFKTIFMPFHLFSSVQGLASSFEAVNPTTQKRRRRRTCQKLIPEPKSISHNYARSCYASILAYLLTWCDISFVEEGKKLKLNGGDFLAKGDQFCYSIFLLSFQITSKLWHSHNWVNEFSKQKSFAKVTYLSLFRLIWHFNCKR